jgi:hypothetical protein
MDKLVGLQMYIGLRIRGKRIIFGEGTQVTFKHLLPYLSAYTWRAKICYRILSLVSPSLVANILKWESQGLDNLSQDERLASVLQTAAGAPGSSSRDVYVVFPPQPNRKRLYLYSFDVNGNCIFFAKVALSRQELELVKKEAITIRNASELAWHTFKLPEIISVRDFGEGVGFVEFRPFQRRSRQGPSEWNKLYLSIWREMIAQNLGSVSEQKFQSILTSTSDSHWKNMLSLTLHENRWPEIPFAMSHGDFAPWNLRLAGRDVILFDWENFCDSRPILYDPLYFLIRINTLLKKTSPQKMGQVISRFLQEVPPYGNSPLNVLLALQSIAANVPEQQKDALRFMAESYWRTRKEKS